MTITYNHFLLKIQTNCLLGDPIQCINDRGVPGHVINTYCWITYTFTLPHEQGKPVGTHVAHPGLGNDNQDRQYHSYYQWVPFVLFFQVSPFFQYYYKSPIFKIFTLGKMKVNAVLNKRVKN